MTDKLLYVQAFIKQYPDREMGSKISLYINMWLYTPSMLQQRYTSAKDTRELAQQEA